MQPDFLRPILKSILKATWPWILIIVVLRIIVEIAPDYIAFWRRKKKFTSGEKWRSGRDLLIWLRGLTPKEFEQYIAHLFFRLGYNTTVTGGAYDGGIDVIAEKEGIKHYIQCKKFITRQVPVGAIRDFYGAMTDKGTQAKGFFITTNKFTLEAEKFAEDKPIELIDGSRLCEYIEQAKMDSNSPQTSEQIKVCPMCGSPMVLRKGKFGNFFGCMRYPNCKGTLKV